MDAVVKKEPDEYGGVPPVVKQDRGGPTVVQYIELSSSDSDYGDSDDSDDELGFDRSGKKAWVSNGGSGGSNKKQKLDMILPLGFLDPLPREQTPLPLPLPSPSPSPSPVSLALPSPSPVSQALSSPVVQSQSSAVGNGSKQFWKAGDYGDSPSVDCSTSNSTVGMDHVRVHPKFLHSNATSHKWALGAFAELLDNSLDEVCYGATFVNIDMMYNKKDGSKMLLIEDNGGGMDPDKMRQCISLGYSAKSKLANVIGQYGNGFKTSTMRLGADVIVFSRCRGKDSKSPTQSIGMLSYTFLKSTGKEDIVVPMLDYEKEGQGWKKFVRSSSGDWNRNVETIVQWSPYSSEAELFHQFNQMSDHGTCIIIYNLWEDDQGELELDFCANQNDIQIRGVNRDEKIEMARQFPNSRHFLTYRHSLRSYASILYFRLPPGFRIVLRGKDVEHHNIVNDMMLIQEVTYRPTGVDGVPKDANMVATVRMGFVKDAKDHIDVQGFNVYHKNRLIKPFWRVWNAAGSDGRGVIGVLEANFVEPAHDKQGFERTTVLQRLESRLIQMQKTYWSSNCHKIGYAPRRHKKLVNESGSRESSPDYTPHKASARSNKSTTSNSKEPKHDNGKHSAKVGNKSSTPEKTSSFVDEDSECEIQITHSRRVSNNNASSAPKSLPRNYPHYNQPSSRNSDYTEARDRISNGKSDRVFTRAQLKAVDSSHNGDAHPLIVSASAVTSLEVDDQALRDRLKKMEESFKRDLEIEREKTRSLEAMLKDRGSSSSEAFSPSQLKMENDDLRKKEELIRHELQLETDRCKSLQAQLKAAEEKIEELNKEQEALINIFAEERDRRDDEESKLRRKLKDASMTIQQLLDKVMLLEKMKKSTNFNPEKP